MAARYDVIVVGAGIVGAASAWQILRQWPACRLLIIEKESAPAQHQSSHNSGVVHAGVYYPAGSLKARMCREGLQQTRDFCQRHALPFRQCGKWIVAATPQQVPGLKALEARARQNGLAPTWLSEGELRCALPVDRIDERTSEIVVGSGEQTFHARQLLCCAGLMSDRLARLQGIDCDFRIIPFRGEFYRLAPRCDDWVPHLVYPVPDPTLPFLGVHLTPRVGGGVLAGPNAILALAREGYRRRDIDAASLREMASFTGFWRLLASHSRAGLRELHNAYSARHYLKGLQQYCPAIELPDLLPAPAGVRAQAVSRRGELLNDFHFLQSARSIHVGNAPSPAATSALPIGEHIAAQVLARR
ncbi:FAD-dependent oxidoreductase [Spongiibacter marinus]|uniref:FAD-dependent oxidoreductase n=1 Tax=Spongiibacter marinus TaxID=354246 RepID=UPI003C6129EE